MTLRDTLLILNALFNKADRIKVITALLQDPLTSSYLENIPGNRLKALTRVDLWWPANLFLIGCKKEDIINGLLNREPLKSLSLELWEKTNDSIHDFLNYFKQPLNLLNSGFIALGIREKLLEKEPQNWNFEQNVLSLKCVKNNKFRLESVFACLYGMIKDPLHQFIALIKKYPSIDLARFEIHALLSNPLKEDLIVGGIESILQLYSYGDQLELLRYIISAGRETIVQQLAQNILLSFQSKPNDEPNSRRMINYSTLILDIEENQYVGMLQYCAGKLDDAEKSFKQIEGLLGLQKEGISFEREFINKKRSDEAGIEKLNDPLNTCDVCFKNSNDINYERKLDYVSSNNQYQFVDPNNLLKSAREEIDTNPEKTRIFVKKVLDNYLSLLNSNDNTIIPWYMLEWNPTNVIDLLISLDFFNRAFNFGEELLKMQPTNVPLRRCMSELSFSRGNSYKGLDHITIALEFSNSNNKNELIKIAAKINEDLQNWEEVAYFREKLLESDNRNQNLLRDYAFALIESKRIEESIQIFGQLVENDTADLRSIAYLGYAYWKLGSIDKAKKFLNGAITQNVDDHRAWLWLGEIHIQEQNLDGALSVFFKGENKFPNQMAIGNALSKIYMKKDKRTKAEECLKECVHKDLCNTNDVILLHESLNQFDLSEEAFQLIKHAYKIWPLSIKISSRYALSLIERDQHEYALRILEKFPRTITEDSQNALRYVIALFGNKPSTFPAGFESINKEKLSKIETIYEKVNKNGNDYHIWEIVNAEIHRFKGNNKKAFEIYRGILVNGVAGKGKDLWRAQAGLAKVVQQKDQLDSAISLLKEAVRSNPSCMSLSEMLIEACLKNDLWADAIKYAEKALNISPGDSSRLKWFTEQMIKCNNTKIALTAYEDVYKTQKDNLDILLEYADIEIRFGIEEHAHLLLNEYMSHNDNCTNRLITGIKLLNQLGDEKSALELIKNIYMKEGSFSFEIHFIEACLYHKAENFDGSIEALKKAIELDSENYLCYVFLGELFKHSGNIHKLNPILKEIINIHFDFNILIEQIDTIHEKFESYLPLEWSQLIQNKESLFVHLTSLSLISENHNLASFYVQKGLEFEPESSILRYLAANFAYLELDEQLLNKIIDISQNRDMRLDISGTQKCKYFTALLGMKAELALDDREEMQAGSLISEGLTCQHIHSRLLFAQSRLVFRNGNEIDARFMYDTAMQCLEKELDLHKKARKEKNELIINSAFLDIYSLPIWAACAACELGLWDEGKRIVDECYERLNDNPRILLERLKFYVLLVEHTSRMKKLKCVSRVKTIRDVNKITEEINIFTKENPLLEKHFRPWIFRLNAALEPSEENIKKLVSLKPNHLNAAALLMAFSKMGNRTEALKIINKYSFVKEVILESAIDSPEDEAGNTIKLIQNAISKNPQNPYIYAGFGLLAEKVSDFKTAYTAIQSALNLKSDEPEWNVWAAELCEKTGEVLAKIQHMKNAVELDSTNSNYKNKLAKFWLEYRNIDEALKYFEKKRLDVEEDFELSVLLAKAYIQKKEARKALKCALNAMHIDPASSIPYLLQSRVAYISNNMEKAMEFAEKARSLHPREPAVIINLATLISENGGDKNALAIIENSITNGINSPDLAVEKALLLKNIHGEEKAIDYLKSILEHSGKAYTIYNKLGELFASIGDIDNAICNLQQSLSILTRQPHIHTILGDLLSKKGDLDKTLHHFSESVRLNPFCKENYRKLSGVYIKRREYSDAQLVLEMAMQLFPKEPYFYIEIAKISQQNMDFSHSEEMLRKVAELDPENIKIREKLGDVVAMNIVYQKEGAFHQS